MAGTRKVGVVESKAVWGDRGGTHTVGLGEWDCVYRDKEVSWGR